MKNFTKLSVSAALSCMKKALSSPSHQEKQSQHVRLFHFHGWPEIGIPADGRGMIDIIAAVQRQQQQSGNHPIIVHCRWGTSLWQFCIMMFQIVYRHLSAQAFNTTPVIQSLCFHYLATDRCSEAGRNFCFTDAFFFPKMSVTINSTFCLSRLGVLCLNHLCDPL